jgi:cytochrome P450
MAGHGVDGRSAQTLGLLYGGTSLTVPVTFWYLFETLRDPSLHARVLNEIKHGVNEETQGYNFMQLSARPLLQSLHAETARMYSSNLAVREVTAPTYALDEKYSIPKGTEVYISHKFNGQFTPGWKATRPRTVAKPLDTFWAERYLVDGGGNDGKREKFSDAGLSGNWTSFGGGEHKCPGRHFARNIGIVTLAVLMGEFEVKVCDLEAAKSLDPGNKEKAFGTMRPRERIAARIRKRV